MAHLRCKACDKNTLTEPRDFLSVGLSRRQMMKNNRLKSLLAVLICALLAPTLQAAQPMTKVVMTTGSFSEREAAMYVAQDHGFFRRYGLDLTFVHVRSGPVGMAALASGESQLH